MSSYYGNSVLSCESNPNSLENTRESSDKLRNLSNNSVVSSNDSGKSTNKSLKPSTDLRPPNFTFGDLTLPPSNNQQFYGIPMGPGLYVIHCLANGKFYIGQSETASYRLGRHHVNLLSNKSDCGPLQEGWNKYGSDNFTFMVLVSGPAYEKLSVRTKLENQLVQLNKKYVFNTPNPVGPSRTVCIRWKDQIFESIVKASEASGVSATQICCLAKDVTNTDWERLPDNVDDESFSINIDKAKPLMIEGKRYRSMKEAERQLGLSRRSIGRRLADPLNFPDWKYFDNSMNEKMNTQLPELSNESTKDGG
jgi:hypothetical protein